MVAKEVALPAGYAAPLLSMFVIPAIYLLLRRRELGMMDEHPEESPR